MSAVQRAVSTLSFSASIKIISTERSIIQTWSGTDWGYSLAVSEKIDTALSGDFDAMIVCGSQRSVDKLALNPHSTRFVEGFNDTQKPIIAINEAVNFIKDILLESDLPHVLEINDADLDASVIATQIFDFIANSVEDVVLAA